MRLARTIRQSLPLGRTLPDDVWQRRHRALVGLLWLHAAGLAIYAALEGYDMLHTLGHGAPLAACAVLASLGRGGRRARAALVSVGLLTASVLLVHTSGGVIEAHFHFFVMIPVIALYEDWFPFLLAFAYVVAHHGVAGALAPASVYNHAGAIDHPWRCGSGRHAARTSVRA